MQDTSQGMTQQGDQPGGTSSPPMPPSENHVASNYLNGYHKGEENNTNKSTMLYSSSENLSINLNSSFLLETDFPYIDSASSSGSEISTCEDIDDDVNENEIAKTKQEESIHVTKTICNTNIDEKIVFKNPDIEIEQDKNNESGSVLVSGATGGVGEGGTTSSAVLIASRARDEHCAEFSSARAVIDEHTSIVHHAPLLPLMQQKAGVANPKQQTDLISAHGSMAAHDGKSQPSAGGQAVNGKGEPLRSVLKRAGQKSRGHRVNFNESKNEFMEADYVIVVHDESEPQLVSIRSFDLGLVPEPPPAMEQVTLSPPEGYKDCFSHAVHETLVDDSGEFFKKIFFRFWIFQNMDY